MALTPAQLHISPEEYMQRCAHLRSVMRTHQLSGVVLFDADYIKYYTGFTFIPTERPIALLLNRDGQRELFVPRLEVEHAESSAVVDRVNSYLEYPSTPHPMQALAQSLRQMGMRERVGMDSDGYPWILGYRGKALSEFVQGELFQVRPFIEDQMMIKSAQELALLQNSVQWANLAHTLLQRYTAVGLTETEVSTRASAEATRAMLDALGPVYRGQSSYYSGAMAGYRGQIGRNSRIPHALANNLSFQPGDVLVTGASAPVWGYVCELERTMVMGPPSAEQKTYFQHMLNLQEIAFSAIRPGVACRKVDEAVRGYYEQYSLMPFWKHHTGHAIGLRYHEAPFLDSGDDTLIQEGMVFTVEPGLYVPELGGFRHSDTVRVTADGIAMMTYYPRDLDSLTLPL